MTRRGERIMRTPESLAAWAFLLLATAGCQHAQPVPEPTFSYYHAPGLDWARVNRVLLLPLDNESTVNVAPEQVRRALAAELQQAGLFEVVPAPPDVYARLSAKIRYNGRFNEAVMIELARCARADLIVLGTISQYSPYRLPRLGLVLQVVSPADAVVVASVDGLWDAACASVATRARAYYHACGPAAAVTETLALESPQFFQRFVCHEAVEALLAVPPPPGLVAAGGVAGVGGGAVTGGVKSGVPCAAEQIPGKPAAPKAVSNSGGNGASDPARETTTEKKGDETPPLPATGPEVGTAPPLDTPAPAETPDGAGKP